ncbi:hypothetical protein VIAE109791_11970 [Vibrio aestuarianus subsp. francensis]
MPMMYSSITGIHNLTLGVHDVIWQIAMQNNYIQATILKLCISFLFEVAATLAVLAYPNHRLFILIGIHLLAVYLQF